MMSPSLRIALISDELTFASLDAECKSRCEVRQLTPFNTAWNLRVWRPDLLLVESAWEGKRQAWKFKIASYPEHPKRNNAKLRRAVELAQDLNIPTAFWNKEDSVHFDRFIDSAKLFEHIFTVDENCVPMYRKLAPAATSVQPLMFAVQPSIHHFNGRNARHQRACFLGSYSRHIHPRRRHWQHLLFETASRELGLTVYDRNWRRSSANYRYPGHIELELKDGVPYDGTADVYRDYLISINVNTVEDSPTMFSRRLIEIIACGGLAATNPSRAVETLFAEYCHVVRNKDEAAGLFRRLKLDGTSRTDREMAAAGADYIAKNHTWTQRLEQIRSTLGV